MNTATAATVTPARTLRAGAAYLTRHGWVQGSYFDSAATVFTPAACLVGAIAMVCYGGPVEAPSQHFDTPEWVEFEAALTYLDEYLAGCDVWTPPDPGSHGGHAYEFNDAKGRTATEVIAALTGAADAWDTTHLRCPECDEPVRNTPPDGWWGMPEFVAEPEHSHVDGTPLCPVYGPDGITPATPVLVEGGA